MQPVAVREPNVDHCNVGNRVAKNLSGFGKGRRFGDRVNPPAAQKIVHTIGAGSDAVELWFLILNGVVIIPAALLLILRWLGRASDEGAGLILSPERIVRRMNPADAKRWRRNYLDELDSAALYRSLADSEKDEALGSVYRRLAAAEERHAEFWAKRLAAANEEVPRHRTGWRTHLLGWLARHFGNALVVPTIDAMERADAGSYDTQPEAAGTPLPGEERSHARLLRAIRGEQTSGMQGPALARLEGPPPRRQRQFAARCRPRRQRRSRLQFQPCDGCRRGSAK